jgi:predicted RNase H-like nuclease
MGVEVSDPSQTPRRNGDDVDRLTEVRVAGVDGCKAGWVVVTAALTPAPRIDGVAVAASFKDVLAATSACAFVAVDIPIGLETACARAVDGLARRLLGKRGSSVFPAPVRAAIEIAGGTKAADYALGAYREAYARARAASLAACGKSLSCQAFGISAKIFEANDVMTPTLQERVFEAHPELAFSALNGGRPLDHAKLRPEGRRERLALLEKAFGAGVEALLLPRGAAWDDVYDACVLVLTAARIVRGEAVRVPDQPPLDARGLRMEIVY